MKVRYNFFLKLLFFNFLVLLSSLIAFFFIAEVYCRVRKISSLDGFRYTDWPSMDIFRPSKFLPFEIVPNIPGYTNSLGMRDKEYKVQKEAGVYRIVVLGDSITMYGKYTDFLEEILNNKQKVRFEVWNCAIGGQGIKEYYYNLIHRALRFNPDMLIIGFCLNDFSLTPVIFKVGRTMHCYRPFRLFKHDWDNWLYCHSNFYRSILVRLEQMKINKTEIKDEEIGIFYLSKIKEIAVQRNTPFFVTIFPYFRSNSESTPEYITIKKVVEGLKIDCVDLHGVFNKDERCKFVTPSDYIHPNDEAHRIAAEVLYRKITSKKFN